MFQKEVVIDARGHLLGRLASTIAKEILNGQHVTVVRCEQINISGSLFRNKLKYAEFRRLRMNTNPKKGPFHCRQPSKMLWRCVRGMLPHKTARGTAALDRMKVYEGIPSPYDRRKRVVIPQALKVLRIKPHRKFCVLGDLAVKVGWKHQGLIEKLEKQRKVKSDLYFKKKLGTEKKKETSRKGAKLSSDEKQLLERCGY